MVSALQTEILQEEVLHVHSQDGVQRSNNVLFLGSSGGTTSLEERSPALDAHHPADYACRMSLLKGAGRKMAHRF